MHQLKVMASYSDPSIYFISLLNRELAVSSLHHEPVKGKAKDDGWMDGWTSSGLGMLWGTGKCCQWVWSEDNRWMAFFSLLHIQINNTLPYQNILLLSAGSSLCGRNNNMKPFCRSIQWDISHLIILYSKKTPLSPVHSSVVTCHPISTGWQQNIHTCWIYCLVRWVMWMQDVGLNFVWHWTRGT